MDTKQLKEYIFENNKTEDILQEIGCHSIKYHSGGYWTCGNFNGDNQRAITIRNNETLYCTNYTRDITNEGKIKSPDLLSLVYFNLLNSPKNINYYEYEGQLILLHEKFTFFHAIKFICNSLGLSYYHDFEEDIPESLKITKLLYEMQQDNYDLIDDDKPLKPISEKILSYYKPYVTDMFVNDGIDYETQKEFEIGYCEQSNRITIPIRSELGDLIGVKGRLFKEDLDENDLKYIYLESCARSKILYGLHKTYPYIQRKGICYIFEAEKACMQAWSMGIFNSVSIGGTKVTNYQIEKLIRLGVNLVFAFDKDVTKVEIEEIANRFVDGIDIYYIFDEDGILDEKESPTDSKEKFDYLVKNCIYKIK